MAAFPGHSPLETPSRKGLKLTMVTVWHCQWGFRTKTWDTRVGCRLVAALVPNMMRQCGVSLRDFGAQKLLEPQKAGPPATTATVLSPEWLLWGDARQLHLLGSALVKAAGDQYSKGACIRSGKAYWGCLLCCSPAGEIPLRLSLLASRVSGVEDGVTQVINRLPVLFCVATLSFWAPQGFCCFVVVQCYP